MKNLAAQRDKISALRRAGATLSDIAAELDCSPASISQWCKIWDVHAPPRASRHAQATAKRDAAIYRLSKIGLTRDALAERFGLTRGAVQSVLWVARQREKS